MLEPLSVRAFAKELGVSHVAVLNAITRGRLRHSIRVNSKGWTQIVDVDLARKEWADNAGKPTKDTAEPAAQTGAVTPVTAPVTTVTTKPTAAASAEEPIVADSLAEAQRLAALELARQRRLANQLRSQELVPLLAVEKLRFEATRIVRENMLNIPARIAGALASETDPGRVHVMLESAIREALTTTAAVYRRAATDDSGAEAAVNG